MKTGETSKFCAGATIGPRKVESIHPYREIATTGTLGALTVKPCGRLVDKFDLWCGFGLMVLYFVAAIIEDKARWVK